MLNKMCTELEHYSIDMFEDDIVYASKFTDNTTTYYIHHSYKHIIIDTNGTLSVVDTDYELQYNINLLLINTIKDYDYE